MFHRKNPTYPQIAEFLRSTEFFKSVEADDENLIIHLHSPEIEIQKLAENAHKRFQNL